MARHRYRRRSYHGGRADNIGHEMARRHIEDAKRLSEELGGTDQDVKEYFFSLPSRELNTVLNEYERQHGSHKRAYAQSVIDQWRTGTRQMSGTVAERLFKLLPPRMPLEAKYKLIENLWNHVGPRSRKVLRVGLDADVQQIAQAVRVHMENVVVRYTIPAALERRFEWLAAGDSGVKQQLLNHFLEHEKIVVVDGAKLRVPVLIEHLRGDAGANTHRAAEVLKIGNHELEVTVERSAAGVRLEEPYVAPTYTRSASAHVTAGSSYGWVFWVVGFLILIYVLSHR
jgi:hypothetical protein